jgi:O-methyltransferase
MEKIERATQFAYSFKETVYSTYNLSNEIITNNIAGDFVECGVASGAQIIAMATAISEKNSNKNIHAFDSFQGIPMAGEFDTQQPGIGDITHDKFAPLEQRLVSSNITVHSKQEVINNFNNIGLPLHNVAFIEGWFQNTIPTYQIGDICMLRLDGDLYESTMVCLEYLYPKVSEGGVIIIDDYALDGCRVAIEHYFEKINNQYPEVIEVIGGGGVVFFYKKTQIKKSLKK